jgi:hypothetical protein
MDELQQINQLIHDRVTLLTAVLPESQQIVLEELIGMLGGLDVAANGTVKATVANMRAVGRIKDKIQEVLVTDQYKSQFKQYASAFHEITALQNQYWKKVEERYKPPKLLDELKKQSIRDATAKLTGAGIGVNVGDRIQALLMQNITGGGSYESLKGILKETVTDTDSGPGILNRYVKQVAVDSINTYNAQYTHQVSSDLGYEWFKYDNTDIETTRPFCDAMTDIKYFHITEVPRLLRAEGLTYVNKAGQEVPVPLYNKTGLPHGMVAGTNPVSFFVHRGGYNCGHQIRPVTADMVPPDIRSRVAATPEYIAWQQSRQDMADKAGDGTLKKEKLEPEKIAPDPDTDTPAKELTEEDMMAAAESVYPQGDMTDEEYLEHLMDVAQNDLKLPKQLLEDALNSADACK